MKNKIYLALIVFAAFQFFTASSALGKSCGTNNNGTCVDSVSSEVSCSSGSSIEMDYGECGLESGHYYLCCGQDSATAATTSTKGTTLPIEFENPLEYTSVEGLLSAVMTAFQGIVVLLALIFFIWGAIVYITSGGSEDRIKSGKNAMMASLIGMALGIAAPSLLKTIGALLGWGTEENCANITDATAKATCEETITAAPTIGTIGINVLEFLLGIVGILGMIMIVVGGIMYFTAGANEKSVETAKSIVKYAIIGLALALASMIIVRQVATLLT